MAVVGRVIKRGLKLILSVAVLAVLVVGIVYGVRKVSSVSPQKLVGVLSPYLAKIGIEESDVGQVAGDLITRVTDFGVESRYSGGTSGSVESGQVSGTSTKADTIFSLALIAESHIGEDKNEYIENKNYLARALNRARDLEVDRVIHVGDISNFGDIASLSVARSILNDSGLSYLAISGDHDLAQTSSRENFSSVFGTENHVFEASGFKFVVFDNSANYTLISQERMAWFKREMADADFVILSQPLYTEGILLFNCQYMGNSCVTPEDERLRELQIGVRGQRDELLASVRNSGVQAVIAGDHHRSSQAPDKSEPGLTHYVVGSVGATFKEDYSQTKLQSQRFSLFKLYADGKFSIEDIVL